MLLLACGKLENFFNLFYKTMKKMLITDRNTASIPAKFWNIALALLVMKFVSISQQDE